jgi:uncharacterized protein
MTPLRCFCWLAFAVGAASFASQPAIAADPWFAPTTIKITTESIVFSNAGATLRGTVYLPANARKVPAVVVLHGASEPLADTPLYRHLCEGLPAIGIAVLLFDRRGSGASSGSANVGYETFAQDGVAGARLLRQMSAIDASRVGYWGISQGGWLAAYAAALDPATAFVIAVSAPLVTAEAQMEFAMSNRLQVLGYSESDVIEMLAARKALDGYFNGSNSRAAAVAAIAKIEKEPWYDLMYLPASEAVPKSPTDEAWRGQMNKDPIAAVAQVEAPTLFILGGEDPWIPVKLTVERLRALAQRNPRVQYVVVPNANHLMMTPPSRKSETMSDADPKAVLVDAPESATYFMLLAAWLQRQLQLRDAARP